MIPYGQYYGGQPTQSQPPDIQKLLWQYSQKGRAGYGYPGANKRGIGPSANGPFKPLIPWQQHAYPYLYGQQGRRAVHAMAGQQYQQMPGMPGMAGMGMGGGMTGAPPATPPWMQYGYGSQQPQQQYGLDQMQQYSY